jgi:hypothetical protein
VLDFRRCFVKVGAGSSVLFFYRVDFYTPFGVLFLWVVTGSPVPSNVGEVWLTRCCVHVKISVFITIVEGLGA